MKPKTTRWLARTAVATVLVTTGSQVLDRKVYIMPETHVETVMMMPTGDATSVVGNTTGESVTFTSTSGLGADAWVVKGPRWGSVRDRG